MPDSTALDPENRALYGEILRAPVGYELDKALATTYTLDFETALVVPATLAFHAAENRQETLDTPLALLEGLERLSSSIAVFCEAGRIKAVPKGANRLTALLEETVTEVNAPRGGAFHPKLWLLRFKPLGGRGPSRLRLALLSRNLTTDASWDLSLSLDGATENSTNTANAPLVSLIRALPSLSSGRATPDRVRDMVTSLANDLAQARWIPPENVCDIRFAVNGLTDSVWRPKVGKSLGIICPFVTDSALRKLAGSVGPENAFLLGRSEELARLKRKTLERFSSVRVLDKLAETEDGEEVEEGIAKGPVPARGLHAKAFITERHSRTEITMGSGNATSAALLSGENVEVFATLSGYSRDLGTVEQQLSPEHLGQYLRDFAPYIPEDASSEEAAEARLDEIRRQLAQAHLKMRCEMGASDLVSLHLSAINAVHIPETTGCRIWPLVAGSAFGIKRSSLDGREQVLARQSLKDVTRWIGVQLTDKETGIEQEFTLGTELIDLPETRTSEILRALIENKEAFLRYIRLLLGDVSEAAKALFAAGRGGQFSGELSGNGDAPLLEDMVRALAGDGSQLRDIERLVTRLSDPDTGKSEVIPSDFMKLWETFREVVPKESKNG